MSVADAVAVAVAFVWLGMVLGISFLEAPLKFRAPGVTVPTGLAIGRVVFRALNAVEAVLAVALLVAVAAGRPPAWATAAAVTAIIMLGLQIVAVRPRLTRRSDQVLAGLDSPRSRGHLVYVGLEVVKALALAAGGGLLLFALT